MADPAETARPLRMAAVIPAGGNEVQRFGVQYSEADTADLFQQAYTILVEALSSANQLKEVTEAEWRQALSAAPGLYFDWQGEVPLEVLDGWLSVENPMLTGSVRRMVLAAREGRVFLCYFDEMAGGYYACASDVVSASRLEEVVETLRDNGARFAFETEEYSGLEPLYAGPGGAAEPRCLCQCGSPGGEPEPQRASGGPWLSGKLRLLQRSGGAGHPQPKRHPADRRGRDCDL